jgi:hypothetical protein
MRFITLFFLCLLECKAAPAQQEPVVAVATSGTETIVYDWSREHCAQWDVPDAPLRAFRNAQGGVTASASNDDNQPFVGPSLRNLRHGCHASLPSHENSDPAAYSGFRYITATWTKDGRNIAALVHNEYHADHFTGACAFHEAMPCWYTTIIAAQSADGGMTFRVSAPPVVVAAIPFRQEVGQGRHRGFFNPSNILFRDGFWFMATNTTGGAGQKEGTCLFRSADINDPTAWRGFDGKDFTASPYDPYRVNANPYVPCEPMTGIATLGSISFLPSRGLYLAVFQGPDHDHPNGRIGYAWSRDMQHWGPSHTLLDKPDMTSKNCSDTYRYGYPSLLDPDVGGRNFDVIGSAPLLFMTRFHVGKCGLPPNRDLVWMQLDVK